MKKKSASKETDLIEYEWRGIKCVRAKGNTGRQAPIAVKQAGIMGKASAISAKLRASFKPLLEEPANRKLMYRLNNSLQQWLRSEPLQDNTAIDNIPALKGFAFEEDGYGNMLHSALPVSRRHDGTISLHIPAFDSPNPISPLPFNGQLKFQVIATSCNVAQPSETNMQEVELNIDYNGTPIPSQEMIIPIHAATGNLTVVAVSVNNMAAGIVGAMWN